MGNYSIRKTEQRERRFERLREATGESSTSKAIDTAAAFYLAMGAVDAGSRVGKYNELLRKAQTEGSLTGPEIAELLDTPMLPLSATNSYSVGE